MRVIVACAGSPVKWAEYLGGPKHLAPVPPDGEPLLARTVRQARTILGTDDIHVTAPVDDDRYKVDHATVWRVGPAPSEYAASRPWWNPAGRTVLLLGDVWFTDAAIATIRDQGGTVGRRFRCFGRKGRSARTGKRYGEIFAASWWPDQHTVIDRHLATVHRLLATGASNRPPGWLLLRSMQHTPLNRHVVTRPWWVEIDDLTDDIDVPADYDQHPALGGYRASN